MPILGRLNRRQRQPEIMDQPDLDVRRHQGALRGLGRINFWSGSAAILWPAIATLARSVRPAPLRVLDVATGGGDVPLRLWRRGRRAGLALEMAGCDVSPTAVEFAQSQATNQEVRFFSWDALAGPLPQGYDVLTCSLFLHHLDEEPAVDLLRRMAGAARHLVLVNDLTRSRFGLALAYVGTRLLSRSAVVHFDGPRSVEGAYTIAESRALAVRAGLADAEIAARWPCRYLLTWRRP